MILYLEKVDSDEIKATISNKSLPNVVDQLTLECIDRKTSIFYQIKEKSYFILKWFINWLCFWNYFQNIMFRLKNPFQSSCKLNIHIYTISQFKNISLKKKMRTYKINRCIK